MIAQIPGKPLKPARGSTQVDPPSAESTKSAGPTTPAEFFRSVRPKQVDPPRDADTSTSIHRAKSAARSGGAKATARPAAVKKTRTKSEKTQPKNTKPQPPRIKKLAPQQVLDLMVRRGDPFGFERALAFGPGDLTDFPEEFRRLLRMVRRRTKDDPAGFANEVLEFGAATIANLIVRLNYYVDYRLQSHAENFYKVPGAGLPQDLTDTILPHLMTMHRHLGELMLMRASIMRQTELARAKRIENQRMEKLFAGSTDSVRQPVNGSVGAARKSSGKKQVAEPDPESLFLWNESFDTRLTKDVRRNLHG